LKEDPTNLNYAAFHFYFFEKNKPMFYSFKFGKHDLEIVFILKFYSFISPINLKILCKPSI